MNIKYYLTTILIFATIFLSGFSGNAQSNLDTIRIEKEWIGYSFYKEKTY